MKHGIHLLFRQLRRDKGRFIRATLGVSVGIAALLSVLVTRSTINESFDRVTNELTGLVDVSVHPAYPADSLSDHTLSQLRTLSGTQSVDPVLGLFRSMSAPGKQPTEIPIFGKVLHPGDRMFGVEIAEGRVFQPSANEILLTETLTRVLGVGTGDLVQISNEGELIALNIVGTVYEVRSGTINRGRVAFIPLQLAQDLTRLDTSVRGASVYLRQGRDAGEWIARARQEFEGVVFEVPEGAIPEAIRQFEDVLLFFSILVLWVAGILVFVTLSIEIREHRRTMALLHLIGAVRRQLSQTIYVRGFAQGVIGVPIGIGLGLGAAKLNTVIVSRFYRFVEPNGSLVIEPSNLALAGGIGLLLPLVMAFLPAQHASTINALNLFRSDIPTVRDRRYGHVIGVAFLVVGVIIGLRANLRLHTMLSLVLPSILIGVLLLRFALLTPLKFLSVRMSNFSFRGLASLAARSALRGSDRSSASLAVITIVLAFAVATLSIRSSAEKYFQSVALASLPADLNVQGIGTSLPAGAEDLLREIEGITASTQLRLRDVGLHFPTQHQVRQIEALIVDPDSFFRVIQPDLVEGTISEAKVGLQKAGALIREDLLVSGLSIGDSIEVSQGEEPPKKYLISGILRVSRSPVSLVVGISAAGHQMPIGGPDVLSMRLEPEADASKVEEAIRDKFAGHTHIRIVTAAARAQSARQLLYDYGITILGIVSLGLVAGMFSLANSLETSVLQRSRALWIMKVLGATKKDLRKVVLWELSLYLLLALLFGTALGLLIAFLGLEVMSGRGLSMTMNVPGRDLFVAFLLISAICLIAGRPALRRLVRLESSGTRQYH